MKKIIFVSGLVLVALIIGCSKQDNPAVLKDLTIDHNSTGVNSIPNEWINSAKQNLHIAYGHTSHGSQLTDGMTGLISFKGAAYNWNNGGAGGALDLRDYAMSGDLGAPDRTTWATLTRTYLASNTDVNVVIWSWCGEVSTATEADINTYLTLMTALENDFKNVKFVYMTGHLDGTGLTGNLHLRNEQIRNYCKTNNKILFDFADIECYNPDGVYFGDKKPNDACDYDSNGDGNIDGNWASRMAECSYSGHRLVCMFISTQPTFERKSESICCMVALGQACRMGW